MDNNIIKSPYKIWNSQEITDLPKSGKELIKLFFQTINLHKRFEYTMLGLNNKELSFKHFHYYTNMLVTRRRVKEFEWLPYEREQNWKMKDFQITCLFGTKIRVTYIESLVKNHNSSKCVIVVHGVNSHRYKGFFYGLTYLRMGYNILVYDARNHGQSEGEFSSHGWYEWQDLAIILKETNAVYNWTEINFFGWSMGAFTVLEYLKNHYNPQLHKFAILEAPVDKLIHVWQLIIADKLHLSWFKYFNLFQQKCRQMYGYDPEWLNPGANLDKIATLPTLIIANENDSVVLSKWTDQVFKNKIFFEGEHHISFYKKYKYNHCQTILKEYDNYNTLISWFSTNIKHGQKK